VTAADDVGSEAGPSAVGPGSGADPVAVGKRFLEAMITGDHDALDGLCGPEFRMWGAGHLTVGGWKDRETFLGRLRAFGGGRSPLFSGRARLDLGHITTQDDRIAIEAEIHAPLVAGGEYNNQFHFLLRVHDGAVVEAKEYMDTHHVCELIPGARPAAGPRPSSLTEVTDTYWSA
jgi:ketosteroid isomerase-like protein